MNWGCRPQHHGLRERSELHPLLAKLVDLAHLSVNSVRTYLNVVIGPVSQVTVTVEYRPDAKPALLVPARMRESYEHFDSTILTTAHYTNFRQFQTSARILESEK
jgi:hypothetical protein